MNPIAKVYLDTALFYKDLYDKTSWWKFRKRKLFKER